MTKKPIELTDRQKRDFEEIDEWSKNNFALLVWTETENMKSRIRFCLNKTYINKPKEDEQKL